MTAVYPLFLSIVLSLPNEPLYSILFGLLFEVDDELFRQINRILLEATHIVTELINFVKLSPHGRLHAISIVKNARLASHPIHRLM